MMETELFKGYLVRLVAEDAQTVAEAFNRWNRDSEYWRLLSSDPPRLFTLDKVKKWVEDEFHSNKPDIFMFMIRTLEDGKLIGEVDLDGVQWNHGDTYVGISLGEREYWDKGYGTDAMQVILRYAFSELNLHRVTLNVFEYNQRAIRSYEKAGFAIEGRARNYLVREGKRWDMVYMGILGQEWLKINPWA